ncbi:MAG: tRNA guanosine(34) transglycosylase Tgt [Candidatus Dadabacteria bacterium]|nr:tRNA guanosine(34) transglycosylase Tgt [Candidatus Dadabacteria bacterium]
MFTFEILKSDESTDARLGKMTTAHGVVDTPAFMPVATQATVKSLSSEEIQDLGFEIIIVNAYHMYLRPGHRTVEKLGGLHKFMSWNKPIATDSGGYQVLSLSKTRKIKNEGILFRSHLDGSEHLFTPAKCIEIQEALGVDIMMCLDECPPYPSTEEYMKKSVELTTRWAKLSKESKSRTDNSLFGIVQGGVFDELREKSAGELTEIGFDGYAVGGLGIGEDQEKTYEITESTLSRLPKDKPRYLMGLGKPEDIVTAVSMGVDMFDCVIPTRNARNGTLFTSNGKLVIKNAQFAQDGRPIEEGCECYTCSIFSRAYLRHLYIAKETLVLRLLTLHNLYFYSELMRGIRDSIDSGDFPNFLTRVQSLGGE